MRGRGDGMQTPQRVEDVIREESPSGDAKQRNITRKTKIKQTALPSVGSWEFELEDDEYLNFLELFLSYLLEKDTADRIHELPLLKGFSHKLREKELHSLTFDVVTTMHRRQRDDDAPEQKNSEPPVFRAGSCFRPVSGNRTQASVVSDSVSSAPQLITGIHAGLFGQRRQREFSKRSMKLRPESKSKSHSPQCLSCSVVLGKELKQGIDNKLESQFPDLCRLLEWMMRWADRRLLRSKQGKKPEKGCDKGEICDKGVVIRIKSSTPAILTSLSLMERRYTALLGNGVYMSHLQIPETQWIVAPVLEPPSHQTVERENSTGTGFPLSANTPTTVISSNLQQEASPSSCAGEPEECFYETYHLQDSPISAVSSQPPEVVNGTLDKDHHYHSKSWEHSFATSSEICTPGTSLKLADLEDSQKENDIPPNTSPNVEPSKCSANKQEREVDDCSNVQSLSHVTEQPAPAADPATVSQTPDTVQPPQMRQRLGEDLYRLVQNINYLSLMEVLGASFSNLQVAQQNASLAQSNLNSQGNVPFSNVPNPMPSPSVSSVPNILATRFNSGLPNSIPEANSSVSVNKSSTAIQHTNSQNIVSGAFPCRPILYGAQEMAPLSVQAGSPIRTIRDNLIPVSQGLLATTEINQEDLRNSAVPSPSGSTQNHPVPNFSGIKLLQLRPPQLATNIQRQGPPSPQKYLHESSPPRHIDQSVHGRNQINFAIENQHQPVLVGSYLDLPIFGRFKGQDAPLFPPTLPVRTTSSHQGMRLLHVQPVSSSNTVLPKLPIQTFSRPSTSISVPIGETPGIKLLQIHSQPKMMLPLQTSLAQIEQLIPEKLMSTVGKKESGDDTRVQLLTDNSNRITSFQNSNKRQQRREKLGKSVKTEVTFRPNDSIIPQETADDTNEATTSGNAVQEENRSMSSGLLRLQGDRLVQKAFATAAELHAFASTSKKPPEQHDAFTNTDPDNIIHDDKSVTIDNTTTAILRKEQIFRNDAVEDKKELQRTEDLNLFQDGHQFISVVDLEDKMRHQDLEPFPSRLPCTEPTAAELHVMATTVLRNDDDSQISLNQRNNSIEMQTEIHNEESASHRHLAVEDDLTADIMEYEAEICGAVKAQALSHSTLSQQPTAWFSSQMSQLDTQLAALQNIADSLETDFSKSRMMVHISEKASPIPKTEKRTSIAVKKTVRLHVPPKRWTPRHTVSTDACSNEPVHTSTADPTVLSPPRRTDDLAELSEISNLGDVNQEDTELSDTAEILDQLVREGILSPTDLDLSTSSARHQNRLDQEIRRSNMSQNHALPEDEKRDEKREIRIWMRKKQRERLADYQKYRKHLREMEHRPFSSPSVFKSLSRTQHLKTQVEQNRVLDTFNQRTMEACNLASDISAGSWVKQGFSETFTLRSSSALPFDDTSRAYSSSVRNKGASGLSRPYSAASKEVPSDDYRRRLGIDRPVTSLPRDRLSQVTRRGMVTNTRAPKSNAGEIPKGSASRSAAVGRDDPTKRENLDWGSEAYRILGEEESNHDITELDSRQEGPDYAITDEIQWDWLDNLSETGSSNLSKIDWAAIEKLVSEEA